LLNRIYQRILRRTAQDRGHNLIARWHRLLAAWPPKSTNQ
jgi:hypothetical protein